MTLYRVPGLRRAKYKILLVWDSAPKPTAAFRGGSRAHTPCLGACHATEVSDVPTASPTKTISHTNQRSATVSQALKWPSPNSSMKETRRRPTPRPLRDYGPSLAFGRLYKYIFSWEHPSKPNCRGPESTHRGRTRALRGIPNNFLIIGNCTNK